METVKTISYILLPIIFTAALGISFKNPPLAKRLLKIFISFFFFFVLLDCVYFLARRTAFEKAKEATNVNYHKRVFTLPVMPVLEPEIDSIRKLLLKDQDKIVSVLALRANEDALKEEIENNISIYQEADHKISLDLLWIYIFALVLYAVFYFVIAEVEKNKASLKKNSP